MHAPKHGDVLIRDAVAASGEFLIADALTGATLCAPCSSIADAVTAARRLSPHGVIWHEATDERGRALSDRFALPV